MTGSTAFMKSCCRFYLASICYLRLFRSQPDNSASSDVVSAAQHYMQENLERHVSLEQLAQYTGYSPSHFSLLFRQQTGQSPLACLNRMKIERACQLLTTTNMRINQICHKVGFDDSYYFSRLFKQQTGLSPKLYRQKHSVI